MGESGRSDQIAAEVTGVDGQQSERPKWLDNSWSGRIGREWLDRSRRAEMTGERPDKTAVEHHPYGDDLIKQPEQPGWGGQTTNGRSSGRTASSGGNRMAMTKTVASASQ